MVGEDFGLFSPFAAKKALTAVSEKCSKCDTRSCSHKLGSVTNPNLSAILCAVSNKKLRIPAASEIGVQTLHIRPVRKIRRHLILKQIPF